jgi:hypothetical protein
VDSSTDLAAPSTARTGDACALLPGSAARVTSPHAPTGSTPPPHLGDGIFNLVLLDPIGTKVETLDDAAARADEQAAIAVAETARADALAAQLRAAGIEPEA